MKTYLTLLIFFFNIPAYCQTDSIIFLKANWETQKIANGVKLKQHQFEQLFGRNSYLSILEIKNRKNLKFSFDYEPHELTLTSEFGKRNDALAAINGTFFDMKIGGSVVFLKVNGEVINQTKKNKDGKRYFYENAAVVINNSKIGIVNWNEVDGWEQKLTDENVMLSGPLVVYNHKEVPIDTAFSFNKTKHPRSLLITTASKTYLIAIDGRSEFAGGMSMSELAKISMWLKADAALNLDGGGSTGLYVKNLGIVNHPSDNKKFDHEGERKVANVIILKN
ncbi:MAG: phosphodiester glycosidase family protein [Sphingobacteriales bacterium]|nr:phosphodiester glycosidase family protein [Sphingobacteriales bacterium]